MHKGGSAAADLGHGPRLSDEEYDRRVVELHRGLPPMPSRAQDRQVRRRELDLAIDHRLGVNFPQARRDQLWRIMERVDRRRAWLIGKYLLGRIFGRTRISKGLVRSAGGLAGFMVDAFSEVLNERELRSYFDLHEGERPTLPVPPRRDD